MSAYHRCSKCASGDMIDGAFIADAHGIRVVVGVDTHPDKGRLGASASTRIHASVCGSCGFVEFYANKPRELWDAYSRGPAVRNVTPTPRR